MDWNYYSFSLYYIYLLFDYSYQWTNYHIRLKSSHQNLIDFLVQQDFVYDHMLHRLLYMLFLDIRLIHPVQ